MKNIIIAFALVSFGFTNAQVAINKTSISGSGLLEFATGVNKGIVLPRISGAPAGAVNGTLYVDKSDSSVKVLSNGSWVSLTDTGSLAGTIDNGSSDTGQGVVIRPNGAPASGVSGALVLDATDKALILPTVANPDLNIKSPIIGTICYDTASKSIAVFNGTNWSYWK